MSEKLPRREKSAPEPETAGMKGPSLSPPNFELTSSPIQKQDKSASSQEKAPQNTSEIGKGPEGLSVSIREKIIQGQMRELGDYTNEDTFQFANPDMQSALDYCLNKWAPSIKGARNPNAPQGDSAGLPVEEHPAWVNEFTEKLIVQQPNAGPESPWSTKVAPTNPNGPAQWNEDSRLAQRLVEAFMHAWFIKTNSPKAGEEKAPPGEEVDHVNSNLAELFERVGASRGNKRAKLLGESKQAYYGWCGPASENAIALGLMRNGFRFKTGREPKSPRSLKAPKHDYLKPKDPEPYKGYNKNVQSQNARLDDVKESYKRQNEFNVAFSFLQEVQSQAAFFLTNWAKSKTDVGGNSDKQGDKANMSANGVGGKKAWTESLTPGDYIYVMTKTSPMSGHVATIVKEIPGQPKINPETNKPYPGEVLSKIYYASGNSKGSAVRVEVMNREMPPDEYDYHTVAAAGNTYSDKVQAIRNAKSQANKTKGKGQGDLKNRLIQTLYRDPEKRKAAAKACPQGWMITITNDFSNAGQMQPLFAIAGISFSEYQQYQTSPDFAKVREAEKAKDDYVKKKTKEGIPVSPHQDNFDELNQYNDKTGRWKPTRSGHGWVVSVVKASRLDAGGVQDEMDDALLSVRDSNQAETEKLLNGVMDKYGLEKMPGSIESLYPGAMDHWEKAGGFS